jgi:hypothetical protein
VCSGTAPNEGPDFFWSLVSGGMLETFLCRDAGEECQVLELSDLCFLSSLKFVGFGRNASRHARQRVGGQGGGEGRPKKDRFPVIFWYST